MNRTTVGAHRALALTRRCGSFALTASFLELHVQQYGVEDALIQRIAATTHENDIVEIDVIGMAILSTHSIISSMMLVSGASSSMLLSGASMMD